MGRRCDLGSEPQHRTRAASPLSPPFTDRRATAMAALMAAAAGVSPLVQGDSAMSRPHASIPANHTHWDGGYLHPLAVGQGGLIVSCLLVLLVGWRTFLQIRHGVRPLDIRKAFHLTLLAATLLEMPRVSRCMGLQCHVAAGWLRGGLHRAPVAPARCVAKPRLTSSIDTESPLAAVAPRRHGTAAN